MKRFMTTTEVREWCKERDYVFKEMDELDERYYIDLHILPRHRDVRYNKRIYRLYKVYRLVEIQDYEFTYGFMIGRKTTDGRKIFEYNRI